MALKPVTIGTLHELLDIQSIYSGSTDDPQRRAREHEREGYSGTMYYWHTQNMKHAENQLLEKKPRHNIEYTSNAKPEPGYVYAIHGSKRSHH